MIRRGDLIRKKRGEILPETILFIILNLAFITILILFVAKQSGEGILIEQSYAKQISLLIDAVEPNTEVFIDMTDASEIDSVWWEDNYDSSITVDGNIITAKFREKGGYSYSFFNKVVPVFDITSEGELRMVVRNG
ncbi:MAG: hypothetical protein KKB31_00290 [Nanoarchaeota archaeon]|nr:hypothetical protein [Nanoarchaeota archaeon]